MSGFARRRLIQSALAAAVLGASGLAAAPARSGGTLRAGLSGAHSSDSWDARGHMGLFMLAAGHGAVFDTLTEVAADGSLRGELATDWQASEGALVWTMSLRKDVRFHDGTPFVADDVIASLRLHVEPGSVSGARPLVSGIAQTERLSDHRLRFTLAAPNADFPWLLADPRLVIYPSGQMARAMAEGIGTGLYRVEHFEPGRRFIGRRVEAHYRDGQAGWFDRLEFTALGDGAARVSALRSGQVDAVDRVGAHRAARLATDPNLRLQDIAGNQSVGFAMRTATAPFDALHVRKALRHAIDREAILAQVLKGHGRIAADSPIGPGNQYASELSPAPFDPDLARHHLRMAGLQGLSLPLSVSDAAFDGAEEAAALFAASAATAGIEITPQREPSESYWRDSWQRRPFAASAWSGRVTEDWILSTALQHGAPWNDTQWGMEQSPRFQSLLSEARSELDGTRRRGLYAEMQQILCDEGGLLLPVFANHLQATGERVATPATIGSAMAMDNARFAERWWRA